MSMSNGIVILFESIAWQLVADFDALHARDGGRLSSSENELSVDWEQGVHWLVVPYFGQDVAPGDPLPAAGYHDFPKAEVRREVALLREALTQHGGHPNVSV